MAMGWLLALVCFVCWQWDIEPLGHLRHAKLGTLGDWAAAGATLSVVWWAAWSGKRERGRANAAERHKTYLLALSQLAIISVRANDLVEAIAGGGRTLGEEAPRFDAEVDEYVRINVQLSYHA